MSEVKFTDDELKQIKIIQSSYNEITSKLGQLSIAKLRLEQQQNSLGKEDRNTDHLFSRV